MNNYNEVKKSFGTQAEKFASYHMSKAEYTDYLIRSIQAKGNEHALEVAAGTCICGRAVAPYVKDITCLDLTEAMLEQGKKLAKQEGIQNISFVSGNAECLPFEDETFDLVITRLSLHHFVEPEKQRDISQPKLHLQLLSASAFRSRFPKALCHCDKGQTVQNIRLHQT